MKSLIVLLIAYATTTPVPVHYDDLGMGCTKSPAARAKCDDFAIKLKLEGLRRLRERGQ